MGALPFEEVATSENDESFTFYFLVGDNFNYRLGVQLSRLMMK